MTEDEAKTKWCPFARVEKYTGVVAINRGPKDADWPMCIGSACMAWRTRHEWFDNAQQEPTWVSYAPYAFEPGPGQERDDGYCGLAGQPS